MGVAVGRRTSRIDREYHLLQAIALLVVLAAIAGIAAFTLRGARERELQDALAPFYTPPDPLPPGPPGELIRWEPIDPAPAGALAWRILYHSEDLAGNDVAVSGMVFAPTGLAPEGGRPVVAWAHPTSGMADECAPSRQAAPGSELSWLPAMLANGWVVVATDYYGLGTPGTLPYLIGPSAANDVINSVRAARQLPGAGAGATFATWGHSEGGHASLWVGVRAPTSAPDLTLVGISAAAPAAELVELISAQWQTLSSQVIGPYVAAAWPAWYPQLDAGDILTPDGLRALPTLASQCLIPLALDALARTGLNEPLFSQDPVDVPAWAAAAAANTPGPPPATVPVFIAQGTADDVVLPETTSLLIAGFCEAGIDVSADWMTGVGHTGAADAAGAAAVAWLADRFEGGASDATARTTSCGPAQPQG
ncbi:MAG: lipase family protein [Acidimicrobiales bacterium]